MNSYGYFTAPTEEFAHAFCTKCTSSYGCVCDLLVEHGHCASCMNVPEKCTCSPTHTNGWVSLETYNMIYPLANTKQPTTTMQMKQFWKQACKVEGVPFTRKEHCAYSRVLATYRRLRQEHEENAVKILTEMSGCE